jgi:ADP-ribosylglycohydrolase
MATPSGDTQLAFRTLDQLPVDDGLNPGRLARRFSSERIFGIGQAVSQAMEAVRLGYRPRYEFGARSPGNGALMRIAPMLVPYVRAPSDGSSSSGNSAARPSIPSTSRRRS